MKVSANRTWQVLRKDLRLGPRSPILLWALVVPLVMTALVRGVFGGLFTDAPRLAVVDEGRSELVAMVETLDGIDVRLLPDRQTLESQVVDGTVDAGLVLPAGFDDAVRAGQRPPLLLRVSGESLPSTRSVLTVALLDATRELTGDAAPVTVDVVELGAAGLPLDLRLLPLLVMYAVAIPGGMVPASSLVEEKERGTVHPLLASPVSVGELLAAKWALGVVLGMTAGIVTLALNQAYGTAPLAVVLAVLVGAAMMAQIGLLIGAWARDTNTLFAAWKGGGLVIFLPVIFFLWPDLPRWPAYLMPAYYFLHPAYAVGVEGAGLADVAVELGIGAAVCVVLIPAVAAAGRWMELRLAAGHPEPERSSAATSSP